MPAITAQGEHRLEKIPKFALGEWNAPPLRIEVLQASHLSLVWGNHGLPWGLVSATASCLNDFLSNPYSRILRESVRTPIPQLFAVSAMFPEKQPTFEPDTAFPVPLANSQGASEPVVFLSCLYSSVLPGRSTASMTRPVVSTMARSSTF